MSFLFDPDVTRPRINQLYTWVSEHQRFLLTVLTGVVGTCLLIEGVQKL